MDKCNPHAACDEAYDRIWNRLMQVNNEKVDEFMAHRKEVAKLKLRIAELETELLNREVTL